MAGGYLCRSREKLIHCPGLMFRRLECVVNLSPSAPWREGSTDGRLWSVQALLEMALAHYRLAARDW